MDKSWINKPHLSQDYKLGVKSFLDFAFGKSTALVMKCPCNRCSLVKSKSREDVEGDLMCFVFLNTYTSWYLHGEDVCVTETAQVPSDIAQVESDSTVNLLDDLFPNSDTNMHGGDEPGSFEHTMGTDRPSTSSGNCGEGEDFDELFADFNQELYTGCTKFTKLSFLLKLYHIKCMCGISDKGISMVLDLLKEAFTHAKLPDSFNGMKKVIRKLGLNYKSIHACPNDCMLYWEGDAEREDCKVCEASRWKVSEASRWKVSEKSTVSGSENITKKAPAKVLRYFPLKPRLQRLFMSSKTAKHMTWHVTASNSDGKLRHPRDGLAWKAFDQKYPEFASDPRNVRLGLVTDGFNPFGTMSSSHSIWPVILFPYNFPPWMSMKQTSMILSMVIPGKHMPGNDIDVYLQPLIKELKELWSDGIETLDSSTKQRFNMRAAIMWTVSDFPGLGNLSGWNTYTTLACPSCNYEGIGQRLRHGRKNCFIGHRRFLPQDHDFRQNETNFDGKIETRAPPGTISGSTIIHQLEQVNVRLGKKPRVFGVGKKRARSVGESSEKNVFDNLVYTLLDDKDKSKDNLNARKDLCELGIRSELWPVDNEKYQAACFTLNKEGKDIFLSVLKNVRLHDGYASNLSSCVDVCSGKLSGLKSHDCHVIMRDLFSVAIRNLLPENVRSTIIELCQFFRDISAKVLDIDELDKLQDRVVLILCRMEMFFTPSFFTVMVHLIVHLTEEAKYGGPVPFRWMYPIERKYKNELWMQNSQLNRRNRAIDIDREMHLNFAKWIKQKVEMNEIDGITDDLRCLALRPSEQVVKYTAYNVNGFKFRTTKRDSSLKTQNNGVYVAAETMSYASSRDPNPRAEWKIAVHIQPKDVYDMGDPNDSE
ncbi:unnamed protein product [Microthlaspi erraticum]|uniref:Transposase-associated domain-containing protein n=1 Tax=Microthlaspi erraticum TaxID=1685480 RepID=A0A6D2L515_9BRAS|nr:unnamed protein product [Microthlaspi erraticum]